MLNTDYRSIDQSTPNRDEELFSDISLEKSFAEATGESFDAAIMTNLNRYASTIPMLQEIGLAPNTPSSWGPNLPSSDLNKKYKTDIFKDDMSDYQARILMKIREEKARYADFSNEYKGRSFLGQTGPQWLGGFGGEAVSNPINLMPFGQLTRFGSVGQGMVTNAVGAVADWSYRKALESRTGDKVGAADLVTDLVVGTALGAAVDVAGNKIAKREAFFKDVTPEEAMGYKRIDELKEKTEPQEYKTWVDEQHTRLLKERASVIDTVATEHAKAGIPVEPELIRRAVDPIPQKLDILEVIESDGSKRKILAPKDPEGVDYTSTFPEGAGTVEIADTDVFKVDGDEYSSLEIANNAAKKTGSDVVVQKVDGSELRLRPIDVDNTLKNMRETTRVNRVVLPEGTYIEVDGLPFDDIGKASAFAKASNTKVTIIDKDGAVAKIDPILETIPRDYDSPKKATIELDGKTIEVDKAAVEALEATAKNPDARILINEDDVKAFQEFDENSPRTEKISELESDVNFLTDGMKAEVQGYGDKAPTDMLKHIEEVEEIDKYAEVEDNVFKAITNCILRFL